MSISKEYALEHKDSPAVLCCRAEAGTVISEHNLEDPAIFPDLVDSSLLDLTGVITIEQAMGATLNETYDSLTALTPDKVSGMNEPIDAEGNAELSEAEYTDNKADSNASSGLYGGVLKISIGEGKDIRLEVPVGSAGTVAGATTQAVVMPEEAREEKQAESRIKRSLTHYEFPVRDVVFGEKTSFENGVLTIRENIVPECIACNDLVKDIDISIIRPEKQDVFNNTIMDVQPIAVKKEGEVGTGVTFHMSGVYMMLCGTDEDGVQIAEANRSDGIYQDVVNFNRPGSPEKEAFIIRVNATIKEGTGMERPGPLAAHQAMDILTQEIREELRKMEAEDASGEKVYNEVARPGALRVLLVKEIMGQGAMHDNLILPDEPCGFIGGRPNVDLGNVPVILRPNEVRDGGIHALTCITPDTKETSLFYWRDPYLERLASDEEIELVGVLFVGSPQANTEKFYVSKRVGAAAETMMLDGAIVTTEGFGNNHIDFASHIEQIGMLGIPVVGCSYCGVQGALVVGNKYMDAMIDHCVTDHGNVEDILQLNTGTPETARRAVALLKNKIAGEKFAPAERKYSEARIQQNQEAADEVYGK